MRKWHRQDGRRTEKKNKERDILIEGAIMELVKKLALGKLPESIRMIPVKTRSSIGEVA